MALLLDTHVLLWTLDAPERLPQGIVVQIESPETSVYFSAARIREIAIKTALEKSISVVRAERSRGLRRIPARRPACPRGAWREGRPIAPAPPRSLRPPVDYPGFAPARTADHRRCGAWILFEAGTAYLKPFSIWEIREEWCGRRERFFIHIDD